LEDGEEGFLEEGFKAVSEERLEEDLEGVSEKWLEEDLEDSREVFEKDLEKDWSSKIMAECLKGAEVSRHILILSSFQGGCLKRSA